MKFKKIIFLLLIVVLLTSCTKKQEIVQKENTVVIQNYAFNPSTITISKGTTITWTNEDSVQHALKSDIFESETLNQGDSFTHTFNDAGTFEYICRIHTSMKGTIVVQ